MSVQKSKQIRNIQDKHLLRNNNRSKSVEWINYNAREEQDSSDLTRYVDSMLALLVLFLFRFLRRKKSLNELNYIWNELQSLQLPTRPDERERGFGIKDSAFTSTNFYQLHTRVIASTDGGCETDNIDIFVFKN